MTRLSDFQQDVARTFFSLDAAHDFLLAGGAALLAHDLIGRTTNDLDLFTAADRHLGDVVAAFHEAALDQGWDVEIIRQSPSFARIEVVGKGSDQIVIDLGVDSAPLLDTATTSAGPTYQPAELAARKLLALFGRAESRDICDMYELAKIFDLDDIFDLATRIDPGFSRAGLIDALVAIDRFDDADFPDITVTPDRIREFADDWRRKLSAQR